MILLWWHYVLGIIGAFILGTIIGSVFYLIMSWIHNKKLKKMLPVKDKKEVSQWLKQDDVRETLLNPGNVTIKDTKEAEIDERQRFDNYREFEKLRRIGQGKSGTPSTDTVRRVKEEFNGGRNIPSKPYFGDEPTKSEPKRKLYFD